MLKRNVLTMSFAPRDNHEAQVQFALERGVPAIIGVLGSIKLPYPARSFDMAQCSRCLIQWASNGMCFYDIIFIWKYIYEYLVFKQKYFKELMIS